MTHIESYRQFPQNRAWPLLVKKKKLKVDKIDQI
jgi:hypothetical protein